MTERFVVMVQVSTEGEIERAVAMDNTLIQVKTLELPTPDYITERVAMLRLCDINRAEKGEAIGRKFSNDKVSVYLSYDEYQDLTHNRSAK